MKSKALSLALLNLQSLNKVAEVAKPVHALCGTEVKCAASTMNARRGSMSHPCTK